jgi:hypothetical protein
MRHFPISLLMFFLISAQAPPASAASHSEITVIPAGQIVLKQGEQEVVHRLPTGLDGPLAQPLVLVAAQPWMSPDAIESPPQPPEDANATGQSREPVAATIKFTVGDKTLPDWVLARGGSAYVINLDTLRGNARYSDGLVAMKAELQSGAPSVSISVLGMPDPLLLQDGGMTSLDGPLTRFMEKAADPSEKAYFSALSKEIAGLREEAKTAYEALSTSSNRGAARFARRGLRMLSYQMRKRKLSGNYMEHYRWGLYLESCGFFDAAFREFEECRIVDSSRSECQFRGGECLDMIGGRLEQYIHYMERAGNTAEEKDPTIWHCLVVIVKARDRVSLGQPEMDYIKDQWLFMDRMLWGATRGAVRLATSFYEVEGEPLLNGAVRRDRLSWPDDDMIETRGWYDSVICVRPRLDGEDRKTVETGGADVGPNGAAIAAVFHDAGWEQLLEALYAHLRLAATVSEVDDGLPTAEDVVDCGIRPAPHKGHALRAALRYHFNRRSLRGLNIAEVPAKGSYLQLWNIEGPFKQTGVAATSSRLERHVLDPIPAGTAKQARQIVSATNFINLGQLMAFAGASRARATSWVFLPEARSARMWIGENDGVAVWLNGRCVHAGRRYAAGKLADRNLTDTICVSVDLKAGWNTVQVVSESWPAPRNKGWGFSVSLTTTVGEAIPGMACVYEKPEKDLAVADSPPKAGQHYTWSKAEPDFRRRLPRLASTDLQRITGVKGLAITADIKSPEGCVAVTVANQPASASYRPWTGRWKHGEDRDVALNNVLDWSREVCCAYRYRSGGSERDLLFLKPEAMEAYTTCLKEQDSATAVFGRKSPGERLLGYVDVPAGKSSRTLLVLDTLLGDQNGWPADEEDLLTPFGPFIPNPDSPIPGGGPPTPPQSPADRSPSSDDSN